MGKQKAGEDNVITPENEENVLLVLRIINEESAECEGGSEGHTSRGLVSASLGSEELSRLEELSVDDQLD